MLTQMKAGLAALAMTMMVMGGTLLMFHQVAAADIAAATTLAA